MRKYVPNHRFLRDMGAASILAGVVLLGLAHVVKRV